MLNLFIVIHIFTQTYRFDDKNKKSNILSFLILQHDFFENHRFYKKYWYKCFYREFYVELFCTTQKLVLINRLKKKRQKPTLPHFKTLDVKCWIQT